MAGCEDQGEAVAVEGQRVASSPGQVRKPAWPSTLDGPRWLELVWSACSMEPEGGCRHLPWRPEGQILSPSQGGGCWVGNKDMPRLE